MTRKVVVTNAIPGVTSTAEQLKKGKTPAQAVGAKSESPAQSLGARSGSASQAMQRAMKGTDLRIAEALERIADALEQRTSSSN